jgi:hypothetical protein
VAEIAYSVRDEDRMTLANKDDSATEFDQDAGPSKRESPLREGLDYYLENGLFVFTATFLRKRGYCCESGCRHCPYQTSGP